MKRIIKIPLIVFSGMILWLAIMLSSIVVHEYYHKFEMRNIEKISDDICISMFANCDDGFGYYRIFLANEEASKRALEITEGWEMRAYLVQTAFTLFCILMILMIIQMKGSKK